MKKLVLMGLLAFCGAPAQVTSDIADLAWMAGDWGSDSSARVSFEEHWIPPAGGMMLAVSRTMAGGKVVEFEFLRIEVRADGIYYVAQPGGKTPVAFRLTQSTKTSARFENPQHDHPKIIEYKLDGPDTLLAAIEGDEGGRHKRQVFRFLRMKTGRPAL